MLILLSPGATWSALPFPFRLLAFLRIRMAVPAIQSLDAIPARIFTCSYVGLSVRGDQGALTRCTWRRRRAHLRGLPRPFQFALSSGILHMAA